MPRQNRFGKEIAAFEGTALGGCSKAATMSLTQQSLADIIAGQIAIQPTSTLLIGGIGSGKTTELLEHKIPSDRLCLDLLDRINELEDTYAHYIDVSLYADISQMKPGVLLAVAGVALSEMTQEIDDRELRLSENKIRRLAYGYKEQKVSTPPGPFNRKPPNDDDFIKHGGIITVQPEEPSKIKQLLEAIDVVKQAAAEKYGNIVLLLDGLDRLHEADTLAQIVPDAKILSEHGIGVVLVGPIPYTLPAVKIQH